MKVRGAIYFCDRCNKEAFIPEQRGDGKIKTLRDEGFYIINDDLMFCKDCMLAFEKFMEERKNE